MLSRKLRTLVPLIVALICASVLPAHAAAPFGGTPCPGVRPGAWMEGPRNTIYTMGFLFKGKSTKGTANYLTTVGNYVFPGFGTRTWQTGGPQAYDGRGKPFGRFVYAVHTDTPAFTTFGLVRIDKNVKTNAQVCHFGGPTAIHEGTAFAPFTIQYYGQGVPADSVSPARTGSALNATSRETVFMQGIWGPGDEGGPVLVGGVALGFIDGGIGFGGTGPGFSVSRLGPWIAKAQKALKVKLTLQTAKPL